MGKYTSQDIAKMTPKEFRAIVRKGEWTEACHEACNGYAASGLVAIPQEYAYDFLRFCTFNPRACNVMDVTEPGDPHPRNVAPDADLRTDLPRYRVFKDGKIIDEPFKVTEYWRDDLVAFILGCSGGVDYALDKSNVKWNLRGPFKTNIPLVPAGPFQGNMVCGCRSFPTAHDAIRAVQISSRYINSHGPPVYIGNPELIGVKDVNKCDYPLPYPAPPMAPNEIPIFWGASITPQNVVANSKIPFMITQYQGRLFWTDKLIEDLVVF
jgi:uncharacterized protein YcsI (UPF0317 family)